MYMRLTIIQSQWLPFTLLDLCIDSFRQPNGLQKLEAKKVTVKWATDTLYTHHAHNSKQKHSIHTHAHNTFSRVTQDG